MSDKKSYTIVENTPSYDSTPDSFSVIIEPEFWSTEIEGSFWTKERRFSSKKEALDFIAANN